MHTEVKVLPHKLLDAEKTCFSPPKITSKFVLAKFQVCCTYHHTPGENLHNRAGAHAGNFENDFYKMKMVPEPYMRGSGNNRCLPLKSTNSKAKK